MFKYKRVGWRKIELTGLKKRVKKRELIIPAVYKGKKVVGVSEKAFAGIGIEKLEIETGVGHIYSKAFALNGIEVLLLGDGFTSASHDSFDRNPIKVVKLSEKNIHLMKLELFGNSVQHLQLPHLGTLFPIMNWDAIIHRLKSVYVANPQKEECSICLKTLEEEEISLFVGRGSKHNVDKVYEESKIEIVEVDSPKEFRKIIKVKDLF